MTLPSPPVPDSAALDDIVDYINRNVLGTQLPYRTTVSGKSGSTIISVKFSEPQSDYFIKLKRPQPDYGSTVESTRASLSREYQTLQGLSRLSFSSLEIPKPLYFDSERLILATTAVPGIPFLDKYRLGPRLGISRSAELASDLRAVGKALHDFHRLPVPPELESAHRSRRTTALHAYDNKLEHEAIRSRPGIHRAAVSYRADYGRDLEAGSGALLVHDDLGLHNLLCAARPGFLDLDSVRLGKPEVDLAQLILSLVDFTMLAPATPLRRRLLARSTRALLADYQPYLDQLCLKPFLVKAGLSRIIDATVRRRQQPTVARRLHDSLLIARQSEFLTAVLEDSPLIDLRL